MATSTHTIADTTVTSALDMASPDSTVFRGKSAQRGNGTTPRRNRDTKYRHVFATHSEQRESCLSPDSGNTPSFVGFRNLMILVLSAHSSLPAMC
jgi:diacylglycerol O-acyltransferase-1